PFLDYLLSNLDRQGVNRVVMSVGYLSHSITDYFGDAFGRVQLNYEIESEPRGTGGAIRTALGRVQSDVVLVINGDTYLDFSMSAVMQDWLIARRPMILACEVSDTG